MDAWDMIGGLEGALAALSRAEGPTVTDDHPLVMLTHKLRGAAAVQGLKEVSGLAAALQDRVTRVVGERVYDVGRQLGGLGELLDAIKRGLDEVGRTTATPEAATGWTTADSAADEILEYFGPEAAEHLETMTKSLLALEQGASDEEVATLFRAVHTLKGAAYTVGFRAVGDLAHRIEDLMMAVRDGRVPLGPAVIEAVFAGTDALRMLLSQGDNESEELDATRRQAVDALVGLLPDETAMPVARDAVIDLTRLERVVLPVPSPSAAERAREVPTLPLVPVSTLPVPRSEPKRAIRRASIRVGLDRLDALMAVVGELVIARSGLETRLSQLDRVSDLLQTSRTRMARVVGEFERKYEFPQLPRAAAPTDGVAPLFSELELDRYDDFSLLARSLSEISADVSEGRAQLASLVRAVRDDAARIRRLTAELRSDITRARMVPIGTLFVRFARPVREAAKAAGMPVVLRTSGESVELDNTIIEQISDPLLHLVQNAIWHGIEPASERALRGKPAQGTVELSAHHRGGFIYVEVEDDGRGIDVEVIKAHAVAKGLMRPEAAATLTAAEAMDLIFLPGLSTAETVSTGAGRGVGMDVVRTNVNRLNGDIAVETEIGVGTRFTLKLPLTVVISDALLVRVGSETLAVPIPAVRSLLAVGSGEVRLVGGSEMIEFEGEWLDLLRLDVVLGLATRPVGRKTPVLVLRSEGRSLAVAVDELLRKEEIVIKGLGDFLQGVGPFGGTAISGDGRLILVLDPSRIRPGREAVQESSNGKARPAEPPTRSPEEVRSRGVVLLVDDSVSVRKFVGAMLTRAGFSVQTAVDGVDALEQLGEQTFDVVITDLELPRMNGYELIEAMRRRPASRDLAVVVLTTRVGEKHMGVARRLGVQHYVTKPIDEAAFVRLIGSLADDARASAAADDDRS